MVTDIWITCRNALGSLRTLIVATLVITARAYVVITAEAFDGETTTIVNGYDPVA